MHPLGLLVLMGLVGSGHGWSGLRKRNSDSPVNTSVSTTSFHPSLPATIGSGTNSLIIIAVTTMTAPTASADPNATTSGSSSFPTNAAEVLTASAPPQKTNAPAVLQPPHAKRQLWGKEKCQADCYQQWKAIFCQDGPACDAGYNKCMKKCDQCQDFCQDEATCCPSKNSVKDGVEVWVWPKAFGKRKDTSLAHGSSKNKVHARSFAEYDAIYRGIETSISFEKRESCAQMCDAQFHVCVAGGADINYCLRTYGIICSACYKACGEKGCARDKANDLPLAARSADLEERQSSVCIYDCWKQDQICVGGPEGQVDPAWCDYMYGPKCSKCSIACGQKCPLETRDVRSIDSPAAQPIVSRDEADTAIVKRQSLNVDDCFDTCDNTYNSCIADDISNTCIIAFENCRANCAHDSTPTKRIATRTAAAPASAVIAQVSARKETVPCTASAWDLCNCNCTDQWNVCLAGGHPHSYCDPVCTNCYYMCLALPGGGGAKLLMQTLLGQPEIVPQIEPTAAPKVRSIEEREVTESSEICLEFCSNQSEECIKKSSTDAAKQACIGHEEQCYFNCECPMCPKTSKRSSDVSARQALTFAQCQKNCKTTENDCIAGQHEKVFCVSQYIDCMSMCTTLPDAPPPKDARSIDQFAENVLGERQQATWDKCRTDCTLAYQGCLNGGHDEGYCGHSEGLCMETCNKLPHNPPSVSPNTRDSQHLYVKRQDSGSDWTQCTESCVTTYNHCLIENHNETICHKNYNQCLTICSGIPHPPETKKATMLAKRNGDSVPICAEICREQELQCLLEGGGKNCLGAYDGCYHGCTQHPEGIPPNPNQPVNTQHAPSFQENSPTHKRNETSTGTHCACCCLKLFNRCKSLGAKDCDSEYFGCYTSCLPHPEWYCTHPGTTVDGSACPAGSQDLNCLPPDETCTDNE